MALKFRYKSKEEVPADQSALYTEREGAWVLDVEDAVERTRLEEVRSTNTSLRKQVDELTQRFDGIDPEEVRKLADEKQRLEEQQQLKAGEVDKVVENRIKGLRTDWERQLGEVTAERDSLNARLTSIQVDQGVTVAATKRGLRPTAVADITARARNVFRLVNGAAVAFEPDGKTARYGRDGITPMTLDEWVDSQVTEAPHLFEPNAGGGGAARGDGAGHSLGAGPVRNPFRKDTWNLTEQLRLLKTDSALAARLKAAA